MLSLSKLKKEVLDYYFLDDYIYEKSEVVFRFGNVSATREDLWSAHHDVIIECWSIVRNYMENIQLGLGTWWVACPIISNTKRYVRLPILSTLKSLAKTSIGVKLCKSTKMNLVFFSYVAHIILRWC